MPAVLLHVRATLRRFWPATLVLALFAGLVGGLVLAAFADAHRGSGALDRFLAATKGPDLTLSFCRPDATQEQIRSDYLDACLGYDPVDEQAALAAMPAVASAVRIVEVPGTFELPGTAPFNGSLDVVADPGMDSLEGQLPVVVGRDVDPGAPGEVVAQQVSAQNAGAAVGLTFRFVALAKGASAQDYLKPAHGPATTAEVVGVVRGPSDLAAAVKGGIVDTPSPVAGPAWWRLHHGDVSTNGITVEVRARQGDVGAVEAAVAAAWPGRRVQVEATDRSVSTTVRDAIGYETLAALLVGLVAALGWCIFVGQALARQVVREQDDLRALAALGLTRGQALAAIVLRSLPLAGLAAIVAGLVAGWSSLVTPLGLAGEAEIDRGLRLDGLILGVGVVGVLAVTMLMMTSAGWLAVRRLDGRLSPEASPMVGTPRLASPTVVAGASMTVQRRGAVSVLVAGLTTALAVAALVGAATLVNGLHEVAADPAHYGVTWDAATDFGTPEVRDAVMADPDVAAAGEFFTADGTINGRPVPLVAFQTVRGSTDRSWVQVTAGREPGRAGELALTARALHELGVSIGDTVSVGLRDGSTPAERATIVGEVVVYTGDNNNQVVSAVVDPSRLPGPGFDENPVAFLLRAGHRQPTFSAIVATGSRVRPSEPPTSVRDLVRIERLPWLLAAIVALLALAALAHALALSVRRNRSQLAVWKTLGFTRRQVSVAVAWQATMIGAVAVVVGVPLGLMVGNWGWAAVIDQLGLGPTKVDVAGACVATAVATMVAANLVALAPGWRAGRVRPAVLLRTE